MKFAEFVSQLRPAPNPEAGDPRRPGSDFHADPFAAILAFPMLFLPGLIAQAVAHQMQLLPTGAVGIAWSAPFVIANLVMLLTYSWLSGRRIGWGSGSILSTARRWAVFFVGWMVVLWGYLLLMDTMGHRVAPQDSLAYFFDASLRDVSFWVVVLMVVVVAPVCEELAFRGMMHDMLRRVFDPMSSIVVTAIFFGLIHGLPYAAPLAVVGLFFGWLRESTGGLLVPIMAHSLLNGTVLVMTIVQPDFIQSIYRIG